MWLIYVYLIKIAYFKQMKNKSTAIAEFMVMLLILFHTAETTARIVLHLMSNL